MKSKKTSNTKPKNNQTTRLPPHPQLHHKEARHQLQVAPARVRRQQATLRPLRPRVTRGGAPPGRSHLPGGAPRGRPRRSRGVLRRPHQVRRSRQGQGRDRRAPPR